MCSRQNVLSVYSCKEFRGGLIHIFFFLSFLPQTTPPCLLLIKLFVYMNKAILVADNEKNRDT